MRFTMIVIVVVCRKKTRGCIQCTHIYKQPYMVGYKNHDHQSMSVHD